jgi:hypothetical protein
MNKALALVAALAIMSLSAAADAAVTLNSGRIVAKNAEALGKFYAAAFGLKETNPEGNHIELIQQPAR